MSNVRFTVFFLFGIAVLTCALVFLSDHSRRVATEATRNTLCTFAPEQVDAVEVRRPDGTNVVSLLRDDRGAWHLSAPYSAAADEAAVNRLVDMATLMPLGDMRTEAELAELHEDFSDFGLVGGGRLKLTLRSGTRATEVLFGARTASGKEVYARTVGLRNVFTLPVEALDAVPADADGFRRRELVACPRDEIAGIDLRAPGSPFVKLVRGRGGWTVSAPVEGPAEVGAVATLTDGLLGARVAGFVLPSAARPGTGSEDDAVKASALEPYGLAADVGHAVTVRSQSGAVEQIVFGSRAGTNLVYALVQNGRAVVTVDAALADLCRAGGAPYRDTRVFPLAAGERLKAISLRTDALVYVLSQGTNGAWRLEAPVVAPADPAAAAAMAQLVLRLRRNDVPDVPPAEGAVHVSVTTSAGALPGVTVPKGAFAACGAFADLRSKVLQELDPAAVRRITVQPKDGPVAAVVRDERRETWALDASAGAAPARVSVEGVKKLLAALTRTEAVGVETVAATPADYRRCGLAQPACTIAVDFDGGAPRRNLLLGGPSAGGGRYASVGGADAVFILSRATVADLTVKITE